VSGSPSFFRTAQGLRLERIFAMEVTPLGRNFLFLHTRFNGFDRHITKHEADLATIVVSASSDRTLMVGELGR
jgi:hypothetical protein